MNINTTSSHTRSRRAFLTAAAVSATAVVAASAPLNMATVPAGAAGDPFLKEVFDILATGETLFATFYRHGVANHDQLGITGRDVISLQAILIEEQIHANFALAHGGVPATAHFSFPHGAATFTDRTAFLETLNLIEEMTSAALLALIYDFSDRGMTRLAQLAGQLMSVEGGHRVAGRAIQGTDPVGNWAFTPVQLDHFTHVPAAVAQAGFLSARPGNDYIYRAVQANLAGVIHTIPPTTA